MRDEYFSNNNNDSIHNMWNQRVKTLVHKQFKLTFGYTLGSIKLNVFISDKPIYLDVQIRRRKVVLFETRVYMHDNLTDKKRNDTVKDIIEKLVKSSAYKNILLAKFLTN